MIDPIRLASLQAALSVLHEAPQVMLRDFQRVARISHLSCGSTIFSEGDSVDTLALVISGKVRVFKIGETGREITLYRFGTDEACILTVNAILSHRTMPAIATVEQDTEVVMIDADVLRIWIVQYEAWRNFVFGLLAQRLSAVITVIDEVAFRRMDTRIAALLLARAVGASPIHITHQMIAAELGSAREVISRILEHFADEHIIAMERGQIAIRDFNALRDYASR